MGPGIDAVIRSARPEDKPAIAEFTHDTFPWGDYVTASFDEWLTTPDSQVFVATLDDVPVAMSRVVAMSPTEIWLHAARVHGQHRRRGLGLALNTASLDWGRQRGAQVARLMVEDWNDAARRQVVRGGYRKVADWFFATRSVAESRPSRSGAGLRPAEPLRLAPPPDVEGAFMSWSTSELARAAHGLGGARWHMRRLTIHHLESDAAARRLWEAPSGWVSIEATDADAWVGWLMTTAGEADTLVEALMTKMRGDGIVSAAVLLPRVPWLIAAFEASGFDVHPNGVWERAID